MRSAFARGVFPATKFAAIFAVVFSLVLALSGLNGEAATISLRDGLVWADVDCGGKVLHFVVDTGAASSCVNLATARRLGMRLGAPLDVEGVGGEATGYRCTGFQASTGGMRLPEEVVALDLSGPARGCSQAVDGLIGADFFRGKVTRIDYARKELSRVEERVGNRGTALRFVNGVFCAPVAVNGSTALWTRLDTGCTDTLDWCGGASGNGKGARKSIALFSSKGSGPVAEVTVGTMQLHGLPVRMQPREIFPGEAGLLGNGALCRYCVTLDGIGKRLVLN